MIITKEEVEKAANNYAVDAYGVPTITCEETVFLNAEEDFKAGVEFSEEYVQQHVQDIIIENQGLKLYKDNEVKRFKKLAIEFANWYIDRFGPDEELFDKFIKERNEANS